MFKKIKIGNDFFHSFFNIQMESNGVKWSQKRKKNTNLKKGQNNYVSKTMATKQNPLRQAKNKYDMF